MLTPRARFATIAAREGCGYGTGFRPIGLGAAATGRPVRPSGRYSGRPRMVSSRYMDGSELHAKYNGDSEIAPIVFAFLERRNESVTKLCKFVIRNSGFPLDEAISECVERSFDAVSTFDPNKGASLDTHVLGTLRCYLIKLIHTRAPMREAWRKSKLQEHAAEYLRYELPDYSSDEIELLQTVLDALDQDSAALLELRYMHELSLEEIAEIFDCGTSKVCVMIQRALEQARQLYVDRR